MIFGSVSKSHVLFGAKGRNGLETSSCCTVWREQDLPRVSWRQTEKSRTVWRELFLQIWRRNVWRGVHFLQRLCEKVLGALAPSALLGTSCCTLWRQVLFWSLRAVPFGAKWSAGHLWPNCLLKKYVLFWLAEKSPTSFCFRQNTTQLALGKYALFWLQEKSPVSFYFIPNTTQLAFGR